MVGSHGLGKLSNVNAHHDEVLPDLPLLKVTPEGFLQGPEALFPADTRHQGKEAAPGWYTTDSVCQCNLCEGLGSDTLLPGTLLSHLLLLQTNVGCGQVAPGLRILRGGQQRQQSQWRRDIIMYVSVCLSV